MFRKLAGVLQISRQAKYLHSPRLGCLAALAREGRRQKKRRRNSSSSSGGGGRRARAGRGALGGEAGRGAAGAEAAAESGLGGEAVSERRCPTRSGRGLRVRRGGEQSCRASLLARSRTRSLARAPSAFRSLAGTHPGCTHPTSPVAAAPPPARTHLHFLNEPLDGCQRREPGWVGCEPGRAGGRAGRRAVPAGRSVRPGGRGLESGREMGTPWQCPLGIARHALGCSGNPETWAMIPRLWDEVVGGHGARWTGPARVVSRPLKPGKEDLVQVWIPGGAAPRCSVLSGLLWCLTVLLFGRKLAVRVREGMVWRWKGLWFDWQRIVSIEPT